jgi:hypothetical protein
LLRDPVNGVRSVPEYPKREFPVLCVDFGYTPKAIVEILVHGGTG